MANLTVVVDDQVLLQARMRALQQGTSVNAVLRRYLEVYAGGMRHIGRPPNGSWNWRRHPPPRVRGVAGAGKIFMNAKLFADTNILVYAFDRGEPAKQSVAQELLRRQGATGHIAVSTQV